MLAFESNLKDLAYMMMMMTMMTMVMVWWWCMTTMMNDDDNDDLRQLHFNHRKKLKFVSNNYWYYYLFWGIFIAMLGWTVVFFSIGNVVRDFSSMRWISYTVKITTLQKQFSGLLRRAAPCSVGTKWRSGRPLKLIFSKRRSTNTGKIFKISDRIL